MANAAMGRTLFGGVGENWRSRATNLSRSKSGRVHFGARPFGGRREEHPLREIRRVKANIAEPEGLKR